MIYFIIGASGSGKTACLEPLKHRLPEFAFYDFDDIGVPDNADKKWRQDRSQCGSRKSRARQFKGLFKNRVSV